METTAVATVGRDETVQESYQLIALDRPQLEAAHAKMIRFVDARLLSVAMERDEEKDALAIAEKNKWSITKHRANVRKLEKRVEFFKKVKAALEDGYVILPNFAMTTFAIRTNRDGPVQKTSDRHWETFTQPAGLLPAGVGRYVDPNPTVSQFSTQESDGKGGTKTVTTYQADEFTDVDFPIVMAKPALMNAAGVAMAKKIFDEVGIAVDGGWRKPDPVLIGRIRNPGRGPDVSFYLGWYFDPTAL